MFLFTPIQIEQLKATHDYLKTDGKPIHFIEADGKPIHCIAADRVAYFWQLVDAVHEILKYYNFPNNPKMSGFYAALLETNNNNVDLALHCMCVFLVVDQLINDNFLHVWEIINLHHKLYVAIESTYGPAVCCQRVVSFQHCFFSSRKCPRRLSNSATLRQTPPLSTILPFRTDR
jgi:hypothetical protein